MDKQLYIEQFKEWLREQHARLEDYDNSIKISEIVIKSNTKQKEIHKERINIAVQEYNKWAKDNDEELIELL